MYAGYRNTDQFPVAIKIIDKNRTTYHKGTDERKVLREIILMRMTDHITGVIKLLDSFELPDCYTLIIERLMTPNTHRTRYWLQNPDPNVKAIADLISDIGPLQESRAKRIFHQVLDTVQKIHAAGVVHRDIKTDNILIETQCDEIKIIDFGCGTRLHDGIYNNFRGTTVLSPPELVQGRGYRAEGLTVWSLGTLLYDMVCGDTPFDSDDEIIEAHIFFPSNFNLSAELKQLIRACLTTSTSERITLEAISGHPWLTGNPPLNPSAHHPCLQRAISASPM